MGYRCQTYTLALSIGIPKTFPKIVFPALRQGG